MTTTPCRVAKVPTSFVSDAPASHTFVYTSTLALNKHLNIVVLADNCNNATVSSPSSATKAGNTGVKR
nr:hypothetical protein HmN_000918200 [Hymenolepis microstoma]